MSHRLSDDLHHLTRRPQHDTALTLVPRGEDVMYVHHRSQSRDMCEDKGMCAFFGVVSYCWVEVVGGSGQEGRGRGEGRERGAEVDEGIVESMVRVPEESIASCVERCIRISICISSVTSVSQRSELPKAKQKSKKPNPSSRRRP